MQLATMLVNTLCFIHSFIYMTQDHDHMVWTTITQQWHTAWPKYNKYYLNKEKTFFKKAPSLPITTLKFGSTTKHLWYPTKTANISLGGQVGPLPIWFLLNLFHFVSLSFHKVCVFQIENSQRSSPQSLYLL